MKRKQSKKYTLTFFLCVKDGSDVLEDIECEEWFEITDEGIIYCINEKEDNVTCYLKTNLRRAIQHYGIPQEKIEDFVGEKKIEGYN